MQTTGDLVPAAAELSTGVQNGVHHLECILPRRVLADRDTATVVDNLDGVVLVDAHEDARGVSGHRFVDGVVDDLVDEMVKAALIGRADVHSRALAHRLEALKDLDARGAVVAPLFGTLGGGFIYRTGFFRLFSDC